MNSWGGSRLRRSLIGLTLLILIGVPLVAATLVRGYEAGDRIAKRPGAIAQDPVVALITRPSPPSVEEIDVMVGEALQSSLGPGGLANLVAPGDVVLIKPNLGVGTDRHEITDWEVVKPIVARAWAAGASRVIIGEGLPIGTGLQQYANAGYSDNITGVEYLDFNDTATVPMYNVLIAFCRPGG